MPRQKIISGATSGAERHLAVLVDVVRQMSETFELEPLLRSAERAGLAALKCERATIFLYDRDLDELYSKVATGTGEIRFSAKLGIAGEAARKASLVVVQDAYADPRFNPAIDRKTGYHTRNILSVPLVTPDREVIGVLQLLNKLEGPFDETDELLAGALGALIAMAIKRQMLMDTAAEKERLEHDLSIARQIQMQLLPETNPEVAGFDVAGWNKPADQTGGDCYGFLPLGNERLLFLIADASGHGIGPALVVTQCRAMLRAMADWGESLPSIATRVNRLLCQDLPVGRFITACFGILDAGTHRLEYVSAGHGPLLLFLATSGQVKSFSATGLPMAITEEAEYPHTEAIEFAHGDTFLLLTDGFIEWARPDDEQYGQDRLVRMIQAHSDMCCADLIQSIHQDVLDFSEGTTQADDLTAVVIRRTAG
ncbi:MAG TPA: GAF domain-containing SpoIIE family protein phosphatase [Phycisphaerae bacterium]|nr:GAF domain-containing SpoIIE family protein phosphatase [Phycisphaerae bacterium]